MSRQSQKVCCGLEVIRFRGSAEAVQRAEQSLLELLAAAELHGAGIYRNAAAPQDLSLHLSVEPGGSQPSELGLRIAASLRDIGQVSHSLWMSVPIHRTPLQLGEQK